MKASDPPLGVYQCQNEACEAGGRRFVAPVGPVHCRACSRAAVYIAPAPAPATEERITEPIPLT